MSAVFGGAAEFYDLLYASKDYAGEAAFVAERIRHHAPGACSLLDLGCGTGRHAHAFAELGFDVLGVDRSEAMLAKARRVQGASFRRADVTDFDAGRSFDAVVSLFHVASYQVTDEALAAFFDTIARHLEPGGAALFDFWYGPAVLADPPQERETTVRSDTHAITRRARPQHDEAAHRVDVHYAFRVEERGSGAVREFEETHAMRYLFEDELAAFAEAAGLRVVACGDWMATRPPHRASWNAWLALTRAQG